MTVAELILDARSLISLSEFQQPNNTFMSGPPRKSQDRPEYEVFV
jgi:hypothetical protein